MKNPLAAIMDKAIVFVMIVTGAEAGIIGACSEWKWFGGNRYCFLTTRMSWSNAVMTCLEMGGRLAVPNSQSEHDFLLGMFRTNEMSHDSLWIDCSFLMEEGKWVQGDGSPCEYANWQDGVPVPENPYCGVLERWSGYWDDRYCGVENSAICELSAVHESVVESGDDCVASSPPPFCVKAGPNGRFTSLCLAGYVIRTLKTEGVIQCASACRDEPRCHSFSLHHVDRQKICKLQSIAYPQEANGKLISNDKCDYFDL